LLDSPTPARPRLPGPAQLSSTSTFKPQGVLEGVGGLTLPAAPLTLAGGALESALSAPSAGALATLLGAQGGAGLPLLTALQNGAGGSGR
jgi:hypothetical protein